MASLNQLKRKISSIKSTSQITNAMCLISTTKARKQMNLYNNIKDYFNDFYKIMGILLQNNSTFDLLKQKNKTSATLWINITSSMGLCGGYNTGIENLLLKNIKEKDVIIQIGKKGLDSIKNKNLKNEVLRFYNFNEKPISYGICFDLAKFILEQYKECKFNKIKINYVKFINAITFEPTVINVYPINQKLFKNLKTEIVEDIDMEFNPNKEEILINLIPDYIATTIYSAIIEAKVSEYSSRRNAMDTATQNADELKHKYTLEYNNLRQTQITNEIIEIVSGNSKTEEGE